MIPGEDVFIILLVVAAAVSITARRLRIPYTVCLALAGIGLRQRDGENPQTVATLEV